MKKLLTLFILTLATQLVLGQNNCARNIAEDRETQLLINEIKQFVFQIDSLISLANTDLITIGHGHGIDKQTGESSITYFISPRDDRFDKLNDRITAILKCTDEDEQKKLFDELEKLENRYQEPWSLHSSQSKEHNRNSYYQNGKIVAIKNTYKRDFSDIGKITIFIHNNKIIYYEKLGETDEDKESIAQTYSLSF
jgi:hypothetical protein